MYFLMNNQENPADAAMPYLDKIQGMDEGYFNPYIQHGNDAYNSFNPMLQSMMSDPAAFLENIMKGYKPSTGYQTQRDAMLKAAGNTAAAGGMRGSLSDIDNQAHITDKLMGDDMQTWLKNVLGIQDQGLQGQEGMYGYGYDASKSLAGDLSNLFGTQAQLAFQGQENQNKSQSDMMSGLMQLGTAAMSAGAFF